MCVKGNEKIKRLFDGQGGEKIVPIKTNGSDMGSIADGSIDLIYSISVLEHIENPEDLLEEMSRKLRKDGLLIITMDIALREDFGITEKQFYNLMRMIEKNFSYEGKVRHIHPLDLLTSVNSPVKSELRSVIGRVKGILKDIIQGAIRKRHSDFKLEIACYGMVMRKK